LYFTYLESAVFVENSAAGVIAAGTAKGVMRRNLFQNTGFGISLQAQSAPLIVENQIIANRSGIVLTGNSKPVVRKNRIEKNTEDGLTAVEKSLPNLGTAQDLGGNIFAKNGEFDLQNATATKIFSLGNQLNPSRVKDLFDIMSGGLTTIRLVGSADFSPLWLRTEVRTTNRFCYGNRPDMI
jgi:parallel beta-helix repeat protein